jgi:ubiquinone/menaquinone biosynthesis C-methylase UbiE
MDNLTEKYDRIGVNYNQTRQADPFLGERLFALLSPKEEGNYLDIGCGTGNYTSLLAQKGLTITGLDPSERMLVTAHSRHPGIQWKQGKAESLDFPNETFDGVAASLTLHHWTSLNKGFHEIARVLKPGGRFLVFTSTAEQMEGYWLNHYFPQMLRDSIDQMPSWTKIESALLGADLQVLQTELYSVQPDLKDQFLYCGKDRPELYFDPEIRHGISSFSDLAFQTEVEQGLQQLGKDIESGRFNSIKKTFQHEKGDYLFVITQKETD